ncbi:hypothetical protein HDV05_004674 [Chytridiales sp. JEL 0842]|nr:hypothetical protein HDV05_004674 [Chytridiales sp. JEL 0842]
MGDALQNPPSASKDDDVLVRLDQDDTEFKKFDPHHSLYTFYKGYEMHPLLATFTDKKLEREYMIRANKRSITKRRKNMTILTALYGLFIAYQLVIPFLKGFFFTRKFS